MVDKKREPWLNPEVPPEEPIIIGGFRKTVVGNLPPEHVDPIELEQMKAMPGVDTNLVEKNGKQILEISTNEMILQTDKITGKKQDPPLKSLPNPPIK